MPGCPILETDRLILREFVADDAAAFFEMNRDPAVTRYTHDGGLTSVEHAGQILIDNPIADYTKHGFGRWACVLKSDGALIGFAGLKFLEDLKAVDVGYRFAPAYWGKGIATEASRPAIAYGFERLGLDEILGLVDPENVASVRVLQKLGLRYVEMIEYRGNRAAKYAIRSTQAALSHGD